MPLAWTVMRALGEPSIEAARGSLGLVRGGGGLSGSRTRHWFLWTAAIAATAGLGWLTVVQPLVAAVAAALVACATWLLVRPQRAIRLFRVALAVLLVGYAFLGRGLAHVGAPPLYVGEVVLGLGILAILAASPTIRIRPLHLLTLAFMGWGVICTIPYLNRYGINSLRDATSWGYATFAFAVSWTVGFGELQAVVKWYRRLLPIFLFWVPVAFALTLVAANWLPVAPGSDVPIIEFKGGDIGVQLAGAGAFMLLGLFIPTTVPAIQDVAMWSMWLVDVGIAAALNRGGMLAASTAALALLIGRGFARWFPVAIVLAAVLGVALILDPQVPSANSSRSVSLGQLAENVTSIVAPSDNSALQGTKDFRLAWWEKIVGYTFGGPYFWTGKGFGVNLADDDGFQVTADDSLRAPHNAHFEFLARMGVPGFALWVLLQAAFGIAILRAALQARRQGLRWWLQIFTWLLVLWAAAMVNMSFDPYLQGPQGAIWFWSVFGLGLASLGLADRSEESRVGRPAVAAPNVRSQPYGD